MIEQLDMNTPWEPEGTEKLVVGAKVRFNAKEKGDFTPCPHCGETEDEIHKINAQYNGQVLTITWVFPSTDDTQGLCCFCDMPRKIDFPGCRFALGIDYYWAAANFNATGLNAAAIELTLVEEL